jgi:hypothetical protein
MRFWSISKVTARRSAAFSAESSRSQAGGEVIELRGCGKPLRL